MGRKDHLLKKRAREDDSELELILNELAADQTAVRIVLQSFLLRLLALRSDTAPAVVAELQDHVFRSINAIPLAPDDEAGGARWKELVVASAEKLFGEITDTINTTPSSGAIHQ